jgi:hypothetical protein
MPFPALTIVEPHIHAPTGNVVRTGLLVSDPELQSTGPIRYDRSLRPLSQVKGCAAGIAHVGAIALSATIIADLLTVTTDAIARTAAAVRIDMDLLLATIGTNETMFTHGCLLRVW